MTPAGDMNAFLAGVEKRAFHMARYAVRDEDAAFDIVQDAMLRLVRRYGDRPAAEWSPLFFTILERRIIDHHRRGKVLERLFGWTRRLDEADMDAVMDGIEDPGTADPLDQLANSATGEAIVAAVATLPHRQRQAFLLRCVENLSVNQTATAMACSEGSVKTHLSRALDALRAALQREVEDSRS
jgi:RNA polymerase sigma-70 factor (ECF subfamily)